MRTRYHPSRAAVARANDFLAPPQSRTRELAIEMRQASAAMQRRDDEQLAVLGIPEIIYSHFQMVGIARIREEPDGIRYAPDPGGRWSFVSPVCVHHADTPESSRPDVFPFVGNLVDLVAWSETAPERWRLRADAASWLGCIEPQRLNPEPVQIWRSPLSWLRNRCAGLVLLTRDRGEIYRLLADCTGGVVGEDDQHDAALHDILARPYAAPPSAAPLVYATRREGRRHAA